MGNLFLGFPVARSKIADMITGTAPPSKHHLQHEKDGSDEVDATGLAGAGGITIPWPDLYIQLLFESIAGYYQYVTASGTINVDKYGINVNTGGTPNSRTYLEKRPSKLFPQFNWGKSTKLITAAEFSSSTSAVADFWLIIGAKSNAKHVGFKVTAGKLYGTVANGSSESILEIETFGEANYWIEKRLLQATLTTEKCEFYVDEVLQGQITTNLPTGIDDSPNILLIEANNPDVSEEKSIYLSLWTLWQAA